MPANNKQPTKSTKIDRRDSISSFESLLRLNDSKAQDEPIDTGMGEAVLYLRVSTQRQMLTAIDLDADGNSISTQREATIKRARKLKAPISREFIEPGHSAQSIAGRPVFRELLHHLEDHPEVNYVIIYMRSRVFRNQTDAAITKRILGNMGVKLISAKEEFGEGYMADAMEAITDIMNEVQVRQSGEDISNKMYHKAKNGGTNGRARIGYLNVRKDVEGHFVNSIGIDPKRGPLVTWAYEQYATGEWTLSRLQKELAVRGLTTRRTAQWEEKAVSRTHLAVMLRDPYYLGMLPYKGEVFPGRHESLVTPEIFEQVQSVLDVRVQRTQRDVIHNHYLRGMLKCGRCEAEGRGYRLTYSKVSKKVDSSIYEYEYYLCKGRQEGVCDLPHLPVKLVENAIAREVHQMRLTPEETQSMREQVSIRLEKFLGSERAAKGRIKKDLAGLVVQEDRLLDLAAAGTLSTERVRERLAKLHVQRHALTQRLNGAEDHIREESDMMQNYLDLLEKPGEIYDVADDSIKRKLLAAYFINIWMDDDGHKIVPHAQKQPVVAKIQAGSSTKSCNRKSTENRLGASDSLAKPSNFGDIFLTKMNVVQQVDDRSNKSAITPLTPGELARLARKLRASQLESTSGTVQDEPVRSLRRRLHPEVICEIVQRYNGGEFTTQLSREYGISKSGLLGLLKEEGVKLRKQPITPEDERRAVKLYQSGLTIKQVEERIGYSYGTIRRVLHENQVEVRPSAIRKRLN